MITAELIARINELAKKQRAGTMSEEEKSEQAALRRIYIDDIKAQVKKQLDAAIEASHAPGCSCGCQHKH